MPHRARREAEAAAATDHAAVQQIRHWMAAHRLEAHRGCTGFRIAELGLVELIASPGSDPSHRQGKTVGSGPRAASWRR
jgi:hypothetical protein